MTFSIHKIISIIVIILFFTVVTQAQDLPPFFDPDVDDTGTSAAPISGLVALGIIIGAFVGIIKLKK